MLVHVLRDGRPRGLLDGLRVIASAQDALRSTLPDCSQDRGTDGVYCYRGGWAACVPVLKVWATFTQGGDDGKAHRRPQEGGGRENGGRGDGIGFCNV